MDPKFGVWIVSYVDRSPLDIQNLGEGAGQDGMMMINSIRNTLGLRSKVEFSEQLNFILGAQKIWS